MPVVVFEPSEGIGENGHRLVERDAMLGEVARGFSHVPFEGEGHAPNVLVRVCIRLESMTGLASDFRVG
jgi:hypothetical protein